MRRFFRRRWLVVLLGAAIALLVVLGALWRSAIKRNRSIPDEPFRIAGNLYYVGAAGMTSFLLTGPEGHVLIDGGYPESAPAIVASIARLGFNVRDVKVLLNTHAHSDHAGGLRALQEASGAELWVSEGDAEVMAAGRTSADPALGPREYLTDEQRSEAGRTGGRMPPYLWKAALSWLWARYRHAPSRRVGHPSRAGASRHRPWPIAPLEGQNGHHENSRRRLSAVGLRVGGPGTALRLRVSAAPA